MNLIYQCWTGDMRPGARASADNIAAYAKRIGADHMAPLNARWMKQLVRDPTYWEPVRPIFDASFDHYDLIAMIDMDVFAVKGVTTSIFDEPVEDFSMIEETHQPALRAASQAPINGRNDERWAKIMQRACMIDVPRDQGGRVRVYNSGVVLSTRDGRQRARAQWLRPYLYLAGVTTLPGFYAFAQNYISAMAFSPGFNFRPLSPEYNRMVHDTAAGRYDERTPYTKLVHVMFRGADHNDAAWHHAIVNTPR